MVKIAVAGGLGAIGREVIDVLIAAGKHDILILSRNDPTAAETIHSVTLVKADYGDKSQLARILDGVHTVLSFIPAQTDPGSLVQKALIDAAIIAGVKRFAPNEWASSSIEELPWYAEKVNIQAYLKAINKDKKILEYSLFQPGLFIDYLVPPGAATKYFKHVESPIDFANRRAIVLDGQDALVTLTTVNDLANVVALAIEYEGEWPVIGGINGTTISTSKLLEIGATVRGGTPFHVTAVKEEDVRAGNIQSPWLPKLELPSIPPEQAEFFSKLVLTGFLLSGIHSSWVVSDDWNQLLPNYQLTGAEAFLSKHWSGHTD